MPIPEFNQYGLLPTGIYECNQDEVIERYCASNLNRNELWINFQNFLKFDFPFAMPTHLYIDGGFTSDKLITSDIDVVADISYFDDNKFYAAFGWWLSNQEYLKNAFRVDFWIKHPRVPKNLVDFFQYVKLDEALAKGMPVDHKKGLLRLEL